MVRTLVLFAAMITLPLAEAGTIYQCTRADGKVYATNRPCLPGESSAVAVKAKPAATAREERIPLTADQGQYWIETRINDGLKVRFLIDTGANHVLIPQHVMDKLTTLGTLTREDRMGTRAATLADGSVRQFTTIHLRAVTVGSRRVEHVTASVGSEQATPLLGTSVLDRLGTWHLDKEGGLLVLQSAPQTDAAPTPAAPNTGDMATCKNLHRNLEDRRKQMDSLQQEQEEANKTMASRLKTLREQEQQLADSRQQVNSRSNVSVHAWNRRVEQMTKEQKTVMAEQEQYQKAWENRKQNYNSLLEETKSQVAAFNKKCSGMLYQDPVGGWKEFPTMAVSRKP